jgi:single-strand DNA-binding protein
MMASLNHVVLLGNLTHNPDLRFTPAGVAVTTFSLALNQRLRQGEGWKTEVCYIDIVVFGRQAETAAEYLAKGSLALVEGRLHWRQWETQDGQRRHQHHVVARTVQFMPRARPANAEEPSQEEMPFETQREEDLDRLPF